MRTYVTPGLRGIAAALILAMGGVAGCTQQNGDKGQEASSNAQPKQESTVDEAARAGLASFRELAAGPDVRSLGLSSSDEAANATLGQKYEIFTIPLDKLRQYRAGTPAAGLFTASPDVVFPVIVNGEVRSSITVTRTDGRYVASEIGAGATMQAAARAIQPAPGDFLARVPALGLQFVGRRTGDRVGLILTAADPRLKLRAGVAMPAEQVLEQLVPLAQAYNGEPM